LSKPRPFNVARLANHGRPKHTSNIEGARATQLPGKVDPSFFLTLQRGQHSNATSVRAASWEFNIEGARQSTIGETELNILIVARPTYFRLISSGVGRLHFSQWQN